MSAKKPRKTGTVNRIKNDVYYTAQSAIDLAVERIRALDFIDPARDVLVDGSAGDNRFLAALGRKMPGLETRAFDLDPKDARVAKKDWFECTAADLAIPEGKRVCFGFNPPFGYESSLVKRFMAHACAIADVDAFVLVHPIISTEMVIPAEFEVVHTELLPPSSFQRGCEPGAQPYDTNASLTFFRRIKPGRTLTFPRRKVAPRGAVDWMEFCRYGAITDEHQFLIRRTGVNFLRQVYIIKNKKPRYFIEKGVVHKVKEFRHVVASQVFFKCRLLKPNIALRETAKRLSMLPRDPRDLFKKPSNTTNEWMNRVLVDAVVYKDKDE